MQIALLDVGRQTGARPAALNITNDERHFRHRRPADRFRFQRNARPGAAGDGEISGKGKTEGQGYRAELVLGLNEYAAVFRQLGSQNFHDRRPRRDRITSAVTHAGGDQSVSECAVAIHRNLVARSRLFLELFKLIMVRQHLADRVSVSRLERHQRGVDDALVFAREFFGDDPFQLLDVETENLRDQPEHENVFALVLGGAAERFNGQTR